MKTLTAAALATTLLMSASPAFAYRIFVSNEKGNDVTVLDGESFEVIHTIKVGQRPRGIVTSPDGKKVYVCASDDDSIEIYDTTTYEKIGTLPSGPDPELMVASPDGTRMYVANEDDNLVTVINLEDGSRVIEIPVGVEPEGMGISPDGTTIVNTSETTNMAHFIDRDSHQIVANVLVDSRPRFAQYKKDSSEIWVSAEIGGTVSVIDNATKEIKHKITFAIPGISSESIQPVGVRITDDGTKAFVALGPANRIAVVDAKTYEVLDYLLVGQRTWQLAFSPDGSHIFTTNGISNDISIIDVANDEVIKSVQVGSSPGASPWPTSLRGDVGRRLNGRLAVAAADIFPQRASTGHELGSGRSVASQDGGPQRMSPENSAPVASRKPVSCIARTSRGRMNRPLLQDRRRGTRHGRPAPKREDFP